MALAQLSARTFSVVDLVEAVRGGKVRIPTFQRGLKWQFADVRGLLDSVAKGYPVGNLLFWSRPAPAETVALGGLEVDAPEQQEAYWVVDGQQRLTSLANALSEQGHRDERFRLAYDLMHGEFVKAPATRSAALVPLPVLFDLTSLFRWFTTYPEVAEKIDAASAMTKAIREYQIPAYIVVNQDEGQLREIFDRLNSYGKRLSRAEVFFALNPSVTSSDQSGGGSAFDRIAARVHAAVGFGLIDDDTVLRCVLARRGSDVMRDIRAEFAPGAGVRELAGEAPEQAYREGERALVRAVRFLSSDCGVPHVEFLAYRYLLIVLSRFFAHFPDPAPRNRTLLRRWFWRSAVAGPTPTFSSYTEATRSLAARIQPGNESDSVQALLAGAPTTTLPGVTIDRFRTNTAAGRIVVAALWGLTPRSPRTGESYPRDGFTTLEETATLASVVSRVVGARSSERSAGAANRMLLLGDDALAPREALERLWHRRAAAGSLDVDAVAASHAVPLEALEALVAGNDDAFLQLREHRLRSVVDDFVRRQAEVEFEDTPPLDSLDLDDDSDDDAVEESDGA